MSKKTVVIGASSNPDRYSFKAVNALLNHNVEVIPLGIKKGEISGLEIINDKPSVEDVHTVSLYVGPKNQESWMDYIISLNPKRVIFNPGTENESFYNKLNASNITFEDACTLLLLSIGEY